MLSVFVTKVTMAQAAVMTGGRLLVGKTAMQGVTLALAGEENV